MTKAEAQEFLDGVIAGGDATPKQITQALVATGDLIRTRTPVERYEAEALFWPSIDKPVRGVL